MQDIDAAAPTAPVAEPRAATKKQAKWKAICDENFKDYAVILGASCQPGGRPRARKTIKK